MKISDGFSWGLFTDWKFGDVNPEDHPDYSDYYLESVKYNGEELSESDMKELQKEYPNEIYDIMFDQEMDRQGEQAEYQRDLILERQEMEDFAQDGDFENMDGSEML